MHIETMGEVTAAAIPAVTGAQPGVTGQGVDARATGLSTQKPVLHLVDTESQRRPGVREEAHPALIALAAFADSPSFEVFGYLSRHRSAAATPAQIALGLGLKRHVVSAALSRLGRAALVSDATLGRRKAVCANRAAARDFLETIHGLARVLRPI